MIKLEIPRNDASNMSIVDRITDLALSHQVGINKKLKNAILTDGENRYEGKEKIDQYLFETEQELKQWWYCAC